MLHLIFKKITIQLYLVKKTKPNLYYILLILSYIAIAIILYIILIIIQDNKI